MGRMWLVLSPVIFLSCIGCGSRAASVPPESAANPAEAVNPAPVETSGDASLATNLPEEAPLPPVAPAESPPAPAEAAAQPAESVGATAELLH